LFGVVVDVVFRISFPNDFDDSVGSVMFEVMFWF